MIVVMAAQALRIDLEKMRAHLNRLYFATKLMNDNVDLSLEGMTPRDIAAFAGYPYDADTLYAVLWDHGIIQGAPPQLVVPKG